MFGDGVAIWESKFPLGLTFITLTSRSKKSAIPRGIEYAQSAIKFHSRKI